MNKNKIKSIRESLGFTQADLAEKTNLSIRTIQRVESGKNIPKGHTLKVLAEALEVDRKELLTQVTFDEEVSPNEDSILKWMNLSALCVIGIPFGNIFIPFWIWRKNKSKKSVYSIGKRIINFQIIWSLSTYFLLILSPFIQKISSDGFSLILAVLFLAIAVNLYFTLKTANAFSRKKYDVLPLKMQLL